MKKILSLVLALAMIFALAIPTFAMSSIVVVQVNGENVTGSSITLTTDVAVGGTIEIKFDKNVKNDSDNIGKVALQKKNGDSVSGSTITINNKKVTVTLPSTLGAGKEYKVVVSNGVAASDSNNGTLANSFTINFKTATTGDSSIDITPTTSSNTKDLDTTSVSFVVDCEGSGSMRHFTKAKVESIENKPVYAVICDGKKVDSAKVTVADTDAASNTSTKSSFTFTITGLEAGKAYTFIAYKNTFTATNDKSETKTYKLKDNFKIDFNTKAITYEIKEETQTANWEIGGKDGAVLTSTADYLTFKSVTVDDKELVEGTDFTKAEGSTIITFLPAFLNNLSVGKHTVVINSESGSATGYLVITEAEVIADTSDNTELGMTVVIFATSAMALISICKEKRREIIL